MYYDDIMPNIPPKIITTGMTINSNLLITTERK